VARDIQHPPINARHVRAVIFKNASEMLDGYHHPLSLRYPEPYPHVLSLRFLTCPHYAWFAEKSKSNFEPFDFFLKVEPLKSGPEFVTHTFKEFVTHT
jgi:hypothetical protein